MSERRYIRRDLLRIAGLGAAALTLTGQAANAANKKPNFVFILVDDLGRTDTSDWKLIKRYEGKVKDSKNEKEHIL